MEELIVKLQESLDRDEWLRLLVLLEQDPELLLKKVQSHCLDAYPEAFNERGVLSEEVTV